MDLKAYAFFRKLTQLVYVDKIILFGSRARNDAAMRSDIDLAIVCPTACEQDWVNVLSIVEDADTLLKIDVIRYEMLSDKNPLKEKIKNEGIIVYAKE